MNNNLLPFYKCWYIKNDDRLAALKTGQPYDRVSSLDYFQIVNRIDSTYLEGYIARKEKDAYIYVDDVNMRLSYLIDYQDKIKVYFTFDSINLYELVEFFPNTPNPIRFVLKRLDAIKNVKQGQAFMIMPFKYPQLSEFYNNHIKLFLSSELNINVLRADDFSDNDIIIETIYKVIEESEFIVADTTFDNKNAFYELGYASALKKEIITIQHKPTPELFFDRSHIRSILYDEKELASFHFHLKSTIQSIRSRM